MMYPGESFSIALSDMDFTRHGNITAKAYVTHEDEVSKAMEFCNRHQVRLLIVRCPTYAYSAAKKLSALGMLLLDTLVFYHRDLVKSPVSPFPMGHSVRPIAVGEEKQIGAIAQESFSHYPGHYHLDPRFDNALSDEIYVDWSQRSCTDKNIADHVLVAEVERKIAGFLTLKKTRDALEMVLSGVAAGYQGKGVYRDLIQMAVTMAQEQHLQHIYTSTQIPNLAVQKTWIRCGMEPHWSLYTFHHWFD